MKRDFIYIILIMFVFFLTGCGWNDVYKKHSEVLDQGVSCEYKHSRSENVDCYNKIRV